MPRRIISSLFTEDAIFACFVRVHSRLIAEAFQVPEGHVPVLDDAGCADPEPIPSRVPVPRYLRRKRRGGQAP